MAAEHLLAFTIFLLIPHFSSSFNPIFLSCGSPSSINFAGDNRTFNPDDEYLSSSSNSKTDTFSSSSVSPLYSSARFFTSSSTYAFRVDANSSYFLRLHFFPFNSTYKAQFNVTANLQPLISSFSPPFSTTEKEFFLFLDTSTLLLTFSPASNNFAFINALELISSNLFSSNQPTYIPISLTSQDDFFKQAKETVYRVNVGGDLITPANDTLWRTWVTDEDQYLFAKNLSFENITTGPIEYPITNGLTSVTAPDMVYSTARTLNTGDMANAKVNLTWSFDVPRGFQYLVRMHFCNCWFQFPTSFYFNVYLNKIIAWPNMNPGNQTGWEVMVPFYFDFVVDAPTSGHLNVTLEPVDGSNPRNVLLNGLEIMKVSNFISPLSSINTESHNKKHLLSILLPSILSSIVLFILLLFSLQLYIRRRRPAPKPVKQNNKDTTQTSWSHYKPPSKSTPEQTPNDSSSLHLNLGLQISITELLFATNNFDDNLIIGSGGFGKVYKGVLHDNTKVAVKRGVPGSGQGYPQFETEIVVLSRIRHRHLVSLIGYCDENSEMILVYEYMEKGTLRSFLYGPNDLPCLSWKQRLEICICAAKGLHYLHTGYSQSIIHRDVKSSNILLADDFVAKVSDFGLSRLGPSCEETHVSTGVKGTFGYFDPEYFKIQKVTEKSDVYSFGVVLFEVLCARPPIVEHVNLAEFALDCLKRGQLESIVDKQLAGEIDGNSLRKFGETAGKCLAEYGMDRPSIGDVLWNLEYALQLQVTHLRRELFDDSVIRDDESRIAVVAPASGMDLREEEWGFPAESDMSTNMVFSQLVKGEGR